MGSAQALYIDTSAIIKLIIEEPESEALENFIASTDSQLASSEIAEIETVRTLLKRAPDRLADCHQVLERLILLPISPPIRLRAEYVRPTALRSLDAIHLASALEIQPDLEAFLGYDNRLIEAAREAGLTTFSPGT
jgi:predicted nucleic acid-binding protein